LRELASHDVNIKRASSISIAVLVILFRASAVATGGEHFVLFFEIGFPNSRPHSGLLSSCGRSR